MSDGFESVLSHIREDAGTLFSQGRLFERLMKRYFHEDPLYSDRFSDVWLNGEWARQQTGFDAQGTGIDLVAAEGVGGFCAIQCKCYAPATRIQKSHIQSFVAASAREPFTARLIVDTEGLEYAGVQGYTGHHMNTVDFEARRTRGLDVLEPVVRVTERLRAEGLDPEIVSGGGTGTHDIDHELGVFTEIQAGTYVLMDTNYYHVVLQRDEPSPFGPALFVRTTVISNCQPGFAITDAGIKEVDVIFGIEHPAILRGAPPGAVYEVVGDDMGKVTFADPERDRLEIGDVVEILPPHCYQTIVLYRYLHVVSGDKLVDIWPVDAYDNW